jgi:hypothetical protein
LEGEDEVRRQAVERLLAKVKVGGTWAAPAGYALKRTGEREWMVLWVANTLQARRALQRTKRACEIIGVDVRRVSDVL